MDWYYARRGEKIGPVAEEQLKELIGSGAIAPQDMVWRPGFGDWRHAGEVEGLFSPLNLPKETSFTEPYAKPGITSAASPSQATPTVAGQTEKRPKSRWLTVWIYFLFFYTILALRPYSVIDHLGFDRERIKPQIMAYRNGNAWYIWIAVSSIGYGIASKTTLGMESKLDSTGSLYGCVCVFVRP